ncbi:peptidyl-prolyl cis-trans isomerase-like 4 [Varroa jacobsoni]|uniref:peptidyl-prolyl cis-trans isomerase-like 4 n=1 Tax=Varroa jacobsoni TaxID=62625 RepID=UPI000BFA6EA1|nr:peptidyl-prolyl cis-trans isomerase-like 4 [Varroa jacobsoni]
MSVVVETTIGDFTVDLYVKERPRTCMNFLKLCKLKYYNMQLFYKVCTNFVCQAGDPTVSGRGGESMFHFMCGEQARFFEVEKMPRLRHLKLGTLSMVNNGDGMLGSQFLLTLGENLDYLDDEHCVFGEVVEGLDFLKRINNVICDKDERPFQDIRISHTVVLDDPFEDPQQLEYPSSPEVTLDKLHSDHIACYEKVDEDEGKTVEELDEEKKDKEAKAQATILEIIGDLPDADMAPPENVLFVCKLNPITADDDLELIFSRFGEIKSCEVIRDWKTGESLQYAFIEFANQAACEQAYFKMDNVLIDDRRIHVDFSQSVAKVKWKGKGRGVVGGWKDNGKEEKPREKYRIKENRRQDNYELIMGDDSKQSASEKGADTGSRAKRARSRSRDDSCPRSRVKQWKRSPSEDKKVPRAYSKRNSPKREQDPFGKRSSERGSHCRTIRKSPKRESSSQRQRSPRQEHHSPKQNRSPRTDPGLKRDDGPRRSSGSRKERSPRKDYGSRRDHSPKRERTPRKNYSPRTDYRNPRCRKDRSPNSGVSRPRWSQEKCSRDDRLAQRRTDSPARQQDAGSKRHNETSDDKSLPLVIQKIQDTKTNDSSDNSDSSVDSAPLARMSRNEKTAKKSKKEKKSKKSKKKKKNKRSRHH